MRISDWSSDVCSSDLRHRARVLRRVAEIAGNALFQRAGLADVQHAVVGGEHAVHARRGAQAAHELLAVELGGRGAHAGQKLRAAARGRKAGGFRSEEHTYELQSLMRNSYAVLCLKTTKTNK